MGAQGKIRYCEERIAEIDRATEAIVRAGTSSASMSAGGGSSSYTHLSLAELRAERARWEGALRRLRSRNGLGIVRIGRIYR